MEVKRTKTPEQALRMLMYRCAKSEVAVSDARRSLVRWGVAEADRQRIVDTLLRERFIDERRYAEAYVREKTGLSRWGVYKIRAALRAKQIPEMLIEEALRQVDPQFMRGKLEEQLRRKMQAIRAATVTNCAASCCVMASDSVSISKRWAIWSTGWLATGNM